MKICIMLQDSICPYANSVLHCFKFIIYFTCSFESSFAILINVSKRCSK